MKSQDVIEQQYHEAIKTLVEKVKADPYILAVIVAGSFSYAQVWEKSDLDVEIIGRDGVRPTQDFFVLVENGVNIHASLTPRNRFKQRIEGAQQGSVVHSYFSHSTLLFSRDASIQEWYDKNASRRGIGERDKQLQLLNVAASTLPNLLYAEKQFYVNRDIVTCFLNLLIVVQGLARIEVLLNDEIPTREVIQPALGYNPDFFNRVYTELINCEKNEAVIQDTLDAVNGYLDERRFIFQPVLDYLREEKAPRSNTEIDAYFKASLDEGSLALVCQWLAWKGIIQQIAVPTKLTVKSQVSVEEPAYYYDEARLQSAPTENDGAPLSVVCERLIANRATAPTGKDGARLQSAPTEKGEPSAEPVSSPLSVVCERLIANRAAAPTENDGARLESAPTGNDDARLESAPTSVVCDRPSAIHRQIREALARLADTLQQDRYVLAAILTSNLAEDNVWEKTTPYVTVILRDGTRFQHAERQLIEENVPIRIELSTRRQYRQKLERTLQGNTLHAILAESEMLFCKEPGLTDWLKDVTDRSRQSEIGERDKHSQLLNEAGWATAILAKAEKWFHLKRDFDYAFVYLTTVIQQLARVETLMHGETPKRKVIYQAIKHNPSFFNAVFTDILDKPKDEAMVKQVLEQVDAYLEDRVSTLFKPLLDFLAEAGEVRTITDIYERFGQRNLLFELACEWLAQKGFIEQFSASIRLTKDSQVSVEQPAYYYDADNPFL